MTTAELHEPIFQYICRFNRLIRSGANPDAQEVRSDLNTLFQKAKKNAAADAALSAQHDKLELVMIFFVDFMVRNSNARSLSEWHDLAAERGELAGDEKFFDLLDEALADRSESATERLVIFYTCMGLGFSGWYTGQPEQLRKKMLACSSRLRDVINADDASRICPEAYENVNTANLIEPPGASLVGISIALVGLVIMLLAANFYLYNESSKSLLGSLNKIIENGASTRPAGPAADGSAVAN